MIAIAQAPFLFKAFGVVQPEFFHLPSNLAKQIARLGAWQNMTGRQTPPARRGVRRQGWFRPSRARRLPKRRQT
jgi:hypothetical protein